MSAFFDLLPTDLQIHVFHVWLNSLDSETMLIRALSRMDIACSTSCQSDCRLLLSLIPPFGSSSLSNARECTVNGLQWLHSRRVAIKSLLLMDDALQEFKRKNGPCSFHLPSVETIVFRPGLSEVSAAVMKVVFRSCPNVTSLETPKLSGGPRQVGPLLQSIGPQLQVLSVSAFSLSRWDKFIASHCRNLRAIDLRVDSAHDTQNILTLLQSCALLSELKLTICNAEIDILAIAAVPQVMRLTVSNPVGSQSILFADVLELRPDILFLTVHNLRYWQDGQRLELLGGHIEVPVIARIVNACRSVNNLNLDGAVGNEVTVGSKLGGQLQSLNIRNSYPGLVDRILHYCGPALKHFNLFGTITDNLLQLIASKCPHMECLTLVQFTMGRVSITDNGVRILCAGCPNMKELLLQTAWDLTLNAVQSMIDCKLPLRRLHLLYCGSLKPSDAERIRQQFKQLSVLPVPEVVVRAL